jgi:DNA-binding MarR family transcriptional regulator
VIDKKLKLAIFLKKSKLRQEVFDRLDKAKTSTDLAKELGKHRSAISRVLINMEKEGFVRCVNPEDDKFRHYEKR